MAKKFSSNNPFKGKPKVRKGAGPVYNTLIPQSDSRNNLTRGKGIKIKEPCFGPYDNVVKYVYEIDTSNGNHLAYVDCDYVE
jgi:hypothetical protein